MNRRNIVYYHRKVQMQPPKRRSKTSRILSTTASVLAIFSLGLYMQFRPTPQTNSKVLAEHTEITEKDQEIINSPLQNIEFPTIGQSAVGTLDQGVIKHTDNEVQAPIASITKVVTALIILEKRPLKLGEVGDTFTLNEKDLQYFNDYYAKLGTVTAVTLGGTMTQYEALQALLLPSSNNMADSLIDRYFSNMDDYVTYANNYLKANGLSNTVVADASGFSPNSKSTPSDLIKLGQLALNSPVIKDIVIQTHASIAVAGDIPNYNPLKNEAGVIGIKPGTTDEAGYCLLFAADLPSASGNNMTIIAATLGHLDRAEYLTSTKIMLENIRKLVAEVNL
jgi:serine-type D-Ala-D-Ala carboxypeptidase (penicillin-binding protein 5/6)